MATHLNGLAIGEEETPHARSTRAGWHHADGRTAAMLLRLCGGPLLDYAGELDAERVLGPSVGASWRLGWPGSRECIEGLETWWGVIGAGWVIDVDETRCARKFAAGVLGAQWSG